MKVKIKKRRWKELTSLITKINANIIREFYANTPRLDMNTAPTYKSYVRGTEVDFSSNAIMKVLGLRTVHFDEPGYHQRISEDPDYDEIAMGEEVKVYEIITSDIQRIAEKNLAGAWLHYPSTIMRLCMKAKVPMEDANPTWLNPGLPITFERMMIVTEAQQNQRPQKGRRRGEPQEEPQGEQEEQQQFQPQNNMDMVQMQELTQMQAENMRAFKEFTTLQDARYGVQADYKINSQIKLSYIADHLHNMEPAFPTYDEYFKRRSEREVDKALLLEDKVKETMKKAGFWQKLTGKSKGETSQQASEKKKKDK
ncbi:hypothetical protein AHAS_Ahas15G0188600 [Arachis hypogaea]